MRFSVTAIVVNFNGGEPVKDCIGALMASSVQPMIMLVDNASTDGSFARLQNLYGHNQGVSFLANPTNLGFARAVNAIAKSVDSDYLLILNPDCMLDTDALSQLGESLDADPTAALAGPCVRGPGGDIQRATYRRFPSPWNSLMTFTGLSWLSRWIPGFAGVEMSRKNWPQKAVEAEAVSGACMLIRNKAMHTVGYFDESYGLHCEDIDLMYRFKEAGWRTLFIPGAGAVHLQGVSSRSRPFWVHRQKHLGMLRFFRKFQAQHTAAPVRWLVYAGIWTKYLLTLPLVLIRR
jgi:GT2 family glycosyltransferase